MIQMLSKNLLPMSKLLLRRPLPPRKKLKLLMLRRLPRMRKKLKPPLRIARQPQLMEVSQLRLRMRQRRKKLLPKKLLLMRLLQSRRRLSQPLRLMHQRRNPPLPKKPPQLRRHPSRLMPAKPLPRKRQLPRRQSAVTEEDSRRPMHRLRQKPKQHLRRLQLKMLKPSRTRRPPPPLLH